MTQGELGTFVWLLLGLVVLWVIIFWQLPLLARSRFRADTSALRDEVVDAVIAGNLPKVPRVLALVERSDVLIRTDRTFKLLDGYATLLAFRGRAVPALRSRSTSGLTADQNKRLTQMEERCVNISRRYLLTGSFTGWVAYAALLLTGRIEPTGAVKQNSHKKKSVQVPLVKTPVKPSVADNILNEREQLGETIVGRSNRPVLVGYNYSAANC